MTLERIKEFSKREQLLILGSEFERARIWQYKDQEKFKLVLERALEIIGLIIQDPKWLSGLAMLLVLRTEVAKFYIGERQDKIEILYRAL